MEKIFERYKENINPIHCQSCYEIDKDLPDGYRRCWPQSFWYIGENLVSQRKPLRIVFVGKTGWDTRREISKDPKLRSEKGGYEPIFDCRFMGPIHFYFPPFYSPYWRFLKNVTNKLNLTLEDIAITNLVKCNIYRNRTEDNKSDNYTKYEYFENCRDIFEKEIKIIKPTHIIFLTNDYYDKILNSLRFGYRAYKDVERDKKKIPWWHRAFYRSGKIKTQFLRTRHPQGAGGRLLEDVVEWVNNSQKI